MQSGQSGQSPQSAKGTLERFNPLSQNAVGSINNGTQTNEIIAGFQSPIAKCSRVNSLYFGKYMKLFILLNYLTVLFYGTSVKSVYIYLL